MAPRGLRCIRTRQPHAHENNSLRLPLSAQGFASVSEFYIHASAAKPRAQLFKPRLPSTPCLLPKPQSERYYPLPSVHKIVYASSDGGGTPDVLRIGRLTTDTRLAKRLAERGGEIVPRKQATLGALHASSKQMRMRGERQSKPLA
jgi:hypothetical protein